MTPGHHLLLHLKKPRIRYPVAQNPPACDGPDHAVHLEARRVKPDAIRSATRDEMQRKQTPAGLSNRNEGESPAAEGRTRITVSSTVSD
jgi:hypothetical protein